MNPRLIGNTLWHRALGLTLAAIAGIGAVGQVAPAAAQLSDDEALTSSAEERRVRLLEIPDALERAFFEHDPTYYDNQTLGRRLGVLGISFTENEIERDGELLHVVYDDLMRQQSLASPPIRTPDLINPYETSWIVLQGGGANPPVRGSEFAIPFN